MPTFVEDVQAVEEGNVAEFGRRLADRVETLGEALDLLEAWTEESRETRAELASKYDTIKSLARDEVRDASDDPDAEAIDADAIPAEDLLDHPDVDDRTKRRLREYSTKLYVYLDEEDSYGEARSELIRALDAELDLYKHLLADLERGDVSVRDAQQGIARFAREETPGQPNRTAADVVLEAAVDEESDSDSGSETESEAESDSGSRP